jgi:hypothetical protein
MLNVLRTVQYSTHLIFTQNNRQSLLSSGTWNLSQMKWTQVKLHEQEPNRVDDLIDAGSGKPSLLHQIEEKTLQLLSCHLARMSGREVTNQFADTAAVRFYRLWTVVPQPHFTAKNLKNGWYGENGGFHGAPPG